MSAFKMLYTEFELEEVLLEEQREIDMLTKHKEKKDDVIRKDYEKIRKTLAYEIGYKACLIDLKYHAQLEFHLPIESK